MNDGAAVVDDWEDDEEYGVMGNPVTFDPVAVAMKWSGGPVDMRNVGVRMAALTYLHGTDTRNAEHANRELWEYAVRLIAGDY